jgi:rare lipoprotein A
MKFSRYLLLASAALMLSACASGQATKTQPSAQGNYKVGQPYQINGIWYYPKEDYSYDETGIASWYGAEFEGRARTANGEIFNKDELTAAHKTLQLPCLARVTNLENGKSVVVRVNDRGPFSGARIIDVSQRAAQLLGFDKQGTAKVRVQVLADESKSIADALRHYGNSNDPSAAPAPAAAPLASVETHNLAPVPVQSQNLQPPVLPPRQAQVAVQPQTLQLPQNYGQPQQKLTIQNVKPVPQALQLAVTGPNQIYVQAGAFSSLENARKMQQSLARIATTRITETVVKGAKLYRVRIGPVPDVPTADATLNKVLRAGVTGARTVVE